MDDRYDRVGPPGGRDGPNHEAAPLEVAAHQSRQPLSKPASMHAESHLACLTVVQASLYGAVALAALRGIPAPRDTEILTIVGLNSYSSPNRLVRALSRHGLIEPLGMPLQRGRWLRDTQTGATTAPPACRKAHWRGRQP